MSLFAPSETLVFQDFSTQFILEFAFFHEYSTKNHKRLLLVCFNNFAVKGGCQLTFLEIILKKMDDFDNWFDLASFSYDSLLDMLMTDKVQTETFSDTYFPIDGTESPYLVLEEKLSTIFEDYKCDIRRGICRLEIHWKETSGLFAEKIKQNTTMRTKRIYGENSLEYVLMYGILKGVSRFASANRQSYSGGCPLNQAYQERSFFYLAPATNYIEEHSDLNLRKRYDSENVAKNLKSFSIYRRSSYDYGQPPVVKYVGFKNNSYKPSLLTGGKKQIKVAFFNFCTEKERVCIENLDQNLLKISRNPEFEDYAQAEISLFLEFALAQSVNIICFPELNGPTPVVNEIKSFLQEKKYKDHSSLQELMLVITGTNYTEDGTNVLTFLSRYGQEVGTYHKNSPFIDKNNRSEILDPENATCDLVDVEGIGRILGSICRDMHVLDHTKQLCCCFHPFLIFTPAYSPSVKEAFYENMGELSRKSLTTVLVCNDCSTQLGKKEDTLLGYVSTPYKDQTMSSCAYCELHRQKSCQGEKEEYSGCVHVFDLDYTKTAIQTGGIMKNKKEYATPLKKKWNITGRSYHSL